MEQRILPEQWNQWNILSEIGRGSFGTVYKAENPEGEICAIKVMEVPEELKETCEKEIELMMSLQDCQHVVKVHAHEVEACEDGYRFYIRMDCLESLKRYTDRENPDETVVIRMALHLCDALEECHGRNVIHRDVKLDNILVDHDQGDLFLADFGVARIVDPDNASLSLRGTFGYMAPEIFFGRSYDLRVDIYSLGMVLYRLMNQGREPFVPVDKRLVIYKDREQSLTRRMKGEKLPVPVNASENFARIILKACAFDPEDRYRTVAELRKDLVLLQKGRYRKERFSAGQKRRLQIGAVVAAFVVLIGGGLLWNRYFHGVHAGYDKATATLTISGRGTVDVKTVNDFTDARHLILEDGITAIEDQCFEDFFALETLETGEGLTKIGDYAFNNCFALAQTDIGRESALTEIGHYAFANTALEEFTLPAQVKNIADGTFVNCMELKEIDLGQVTSIGRDAFDGCVKLESPDIPDSLISLGEAAFRHCSHVKKIQVPAGIKEIPREAFRECTGLESIVLGKDTTSLAEDCLAYCDALTEIDGIDRINEFGVNCLTGSKWLSDEEKVHDWVIVGDRYLLSYAGDDREVTIPSQVTYIGSDAFNGNTKLKKITIHGDVTYIGDSAFCGCAYADIIFEDRDRVKYVGDDAFTGTKLTAER